MRRLLWTSLLCAASAAIAQDAAVAPPPPLPPVAEAAPANVEPKPSPPAPTARDRRGGTVGVGYLGLGSMVPIGGLSGGLGGLGGNLRVQVPVLGVRWWLRHSRLGLDLGVGAMLSSSPDFPQSSFSGPSLQLLAHVGLPIAVASTQHVIVLLAPEFRAGLSTLTSSSGITGSLLELGVRGAVELFFGFIGVPELSVEAAIRVGVAREAQSFSFSAPLNFNTSTTEVYRFSTSLSGDAGSVVASTLSLKYYF